jgi:hypothetical protein
MDEAVELRATSTKTGEMERHHSMDLRVGGKIRRGEVMLGPKRIQPTARELLTNQCTCCWCLLRMSEWPSESVTCGKTGRRVWKCQEPD